MVSLANLSICPDRCNERGTCFRWPTEPEFKPICACDEKWFGRACESVHQNPWSPRREKSSYDQWQSIHGVACTSNVTAKSCDRCGVRAPPFFHRRRSRAQIPAAATGQGGA